MRSAVKLKKLFNINVEELQKYIPNSFYRGPFKLHSGLMVTSEYISNSNDASSIIWFEEKTEDGFKKIISDLSPKQIASLLEPIPSEIKNPLIEALKNTELEIPQLNQYDRKLIQEEQERKLRDEELLKKSNAIGQKESNGQFTNKEAYSILQGYIGYTNSKSTKPILGTYGAGPCIIIYIYNPKTFAASLTHIDPTVHANGILNSMIYSLRKEENEKLEIHLRGGDGSSKEFAMKLLNDLSQKNNIELKSCSLLSGDHESKSLAIDSRNGQIYTDFLVNQLEAHPDENTLIQMYAMTTQIDFMRKDIKPAKVLFDGRKEEFQIKEVFAASQEIDLKDIKSTERVKKAEVNRNIS